MAIEDLGVVEQADLPSSPLNPGGSKGLSGLLQRELQGLKKDFSSPMNLLKALLGPGPLSAGYAKLFGGTPREGQESILNLLGGLASMHPAVGPALGAATKGGRILGSALTPMLAQGATGNLDPFSMAVKGILGAGTQGATEGVLAGAKQVGMHRLANKARTKFDDDLVKAKERMADDIAGNARQESLDEQAHVQAKASYRDLHTQKTEALRAQHEAKKKATLQGHEAQVKRQKDDLALAQKSHAEQASTVIVRDAKSVVPWWQEITEDMAGVNDIVRGKGQQLLSEGYQPAMEEAMAAAAGQPVMLDLADMTRLRIPMMEGTRGGVALDGVNITHGVADAAIAIDRLTHRPSNLKKDWGLYHRVANALDESGVNIDPAAREAYKAGMAVIEAIDKTGGIKHVPGEPYQLDPGKILDGMEAVKNVDIIRKRGLGDANTAPFMRALMEGEPKIPQEIPEPYIDPFLPPSAPLEPLPPVKEPFTPEALPLSPDELGEIAGPQLGTAGQRIRLGGVAGGALGLLTDMGNPWHWGPMTGGGMLAGAALPSQWVTKAPGDAPLKALIGDLATAGGVVNRTGLTEATKALGLLPEDVSPEDRAEIEAVKAKRLKALQENLPPEPEGLELLLGDLGR